MGHFIQRSTVEASHPEILHEWDKWLDDNPDPGHYDCYDDFSTGKKHLMVDTFMPDHLWDRIYAHV